MFLSTWLGGRRYQNICWANATIASWWNICKNSRYPKDPDCNSAWRRGAKPRKTGTINIGCEIRTCANEMRWWVSYLYTLKHLGLLISLPIHEFILCNINSILGFSNYVSISKLTSTGNQIARAANVTRMLCQLVKLIYLYSGTIMFKY